MTTATRPLTTAEVSTEVAAPKPLPKPSELLRRAIRDGLRQTRKRLFWEDSYCAIGAMLYEADPWAITAYKKWERQEWVGSCPVNLSELLDKVLPKRPDKNGWRDYIVIHNDFDKWTFGQIADWLESEGL